MLSKTLRGLVKATGFNNVTTYDTRAAHLTKTQPVLDTGQFLGAFAKTREVPVSCNMSACRYVCRYARFSMEGYP